MDTRTTTRLLDDLRDPANAGAWSSFDARYRPVLAALARRLDFSPDDAAEIAQQTLAEFSRAYAQGRYTRGKGRLSSWLLGIARNTALAMRRDRGARRVGGDSMMAEMPDEAHMTRLWGDERERAILAEALGILRDSTRTDENTIRAFELFAIRGVPAEEVASQCSITVDAVYVAKNRLIKRLREIVRDLTTAYDEEGQ